MLVGVMAPKPAHAKAMLKALIAEASSRNALMASLFPAQSAAVNDPNSKVCIWTTRRAGKSRGILSYFLDDGQKHPGSHYVFIALTHPSAEDLAWPILKEIDREFNLGLKFQEAKLRATLPNGSSIKLYGADRPGWMYRLYGQKLRGVAIDEAAFYTIDLRALIDDVLEPCVIDLHGKIFLMSIPGHLPRGLFDDIIKGYDGRSNLRGVRPKSEPEWSLHRWTTADNPSMAQKFAERIAKKLAENPNVENDPSFQRNYRGLRVAEIGERVYRFDPDRNTYHRTDENGEVSFDWKRSPGDHFILGIDFGWDDYQAFSLNVWRDDSPDFVELESHRKKHMLLDEIYSWTKMYQDWCGADLQMVADPAHKQLFEEFRRRFDVPVIPAEKANKFDWISVQNTDWMAGVIKVVSPASSPHAQEMTDLTWHVKRDGWKVEQPGAKNDCCDAFLVAYRHGYHYRHKEPEPQLGRDAQAEADMLALIENEYEERAWNEI